MEDGVFSQTGLRVFFFSPPHPGRIWILLIFVFRGYGGLLTGGIVSVQWGLTLDFPACYTYSNNEWSYFATPRCTWLSFEEKITFTFASMPLMNCCYIRALVGFVISSSDFIRNQWRNLRYRTENGLVVGDNLTQLIQSNL